MTVVTGATVVAGVGASGRGRSGRGAKGGPTYNILTLGLYEFEYVLSSSMS